jgi:hypothetical protein
LRGFAFSKIPPLFFVWMRHLTETKMVSLKQNEHAAVTLLNETMIVGITQEISDHQTDNERIPLGFSTSETKI